MVSDDILNKATDRLVAGFHPQRIILFGSQARGTADEHSDVDLLVVSPVEGSRRALMVAMDFNKMLKSRMGGMAFLTSLTNTKRPTSFFSSFTDFENSFIPTDGNTSANS